MLKPIKTVKEHEKYLSRAYELMQMDLMENSKESDELEVISILIEAFEKQQYPIEAPNTIDELGMSKTN